MNDAQRQALTALLETEPSPEDWDDIETAIAEKQMDPDGGATEAADFSTDFVPLVEKAVRADGLISVKVIKPGMGSSGYYPAEVLERDGAKVFARGTKMYADHATAAEEAERPEGSIKNLVGEFVSDARYEAQGAAGPGLYADAKVFEHWRPFIEELAPHIGVSIRASGRAKPGEVEGRRVPVIEELVSARSVDFVTTPGAGGQVLTLFESARARAQAITPGGEDDVDESKLQEAVAAREAAETQLKEANEKIAGLEAEKTTLAEKVARLEEGELLRETRAFVAESLPAELPDLTKARLLETLSVKPIVKDGALDREAMKEAVDAAVKTEVEYLAGITESGTIRGMGAGQTETEDTDKQALKESFMRAGLTEEQAEIAAQGR